jgi:hypothetical protein
MTAPRSGRGVGMTLPRSRQGLAVTRFAAAKELP